MNTAEIVVREVQGDSGFQVRQLFAERIRKPRQSPHLHSHSEVLPFHVASRDVVRIGPSVDDLGYNLRESRWGVPRVGAIVLSVIPEQFHKLSEVRLSAKNALDRTVEVVAVRRDLETIFGQALLESGQELNRGFFGALANLEMGDKFSLCVKRDENPLIAKLRRIAFTNAALLLSAERPDFIALQILGTQAVHLRFHCLRSALPSHKKQAHDRISIESGEPLRAANGAAFDKALNRTRCRVGLRDHRIPRQSLVRFTEGSFAGIAAPALNAALTEVSEPLAGLVFASNAGHGVSPLAFCGETGQNSLWSEAWVTPRFGLVPSAARTADGALIVKGYELYWKNRSEERRVGDKG